MSTGRPYQGGAGHAGPNDGPTTTTQRRDGREEKTDKDGLEPYTPPSVPRMLTIAAGSTVCYAAFDTMWRAMLARNPAFRKLAPERQTRIASYGRSMLNATVTSGYCWYKIWKDRKPGAGLFQLTRRDGVLEVVMVMLGYFIHDFWSARDVWMAYPAEVVHHVLAIGCCGFGGIACATYVPSIVGIGAHVMGIEVSTIFLDLMWALRQAKAESSAAYKLSLLGFVLTFYFARVANLLGIYLTFARKYPVAWKNIGVSLRVMLWALWLLQLYWFKGIVQLVVNKVRGR